MRASADRATDGANGVAGQGVQAGPAGQVPHPQRAVIPPETATRPSADTATERTGAVCPVRLGCGQASWSRPRKPRPASWRQRSTSRGFSPIPRNGAGGPQRAGRAGPVSSRQEHLGAARRGRYRCGAGEQLLGTVRTRVTPPRAVPTCRRHIPHPHRCVVAAGDRDAAVGRHRHRHHRAVWPVRVRRQTPLARSHTRTVIVPAAGDRDAAVGRHRHRVHSLTCGRSGCADRPRWPGPTPAPSRPSWRRRPRCGRRPTSPPTPPASGGRRVCRQAPLRRSHTRTVSSQLPETAMRPSADTATEFTEFRWPVRV